MPESSEARAVRPLLSGFVLALSFLTILPVRQRVPNGGISRAAGWFPLVGGLIGALAGGIRAGAEPGLGRGPATALALVCLVAVTGAIHQDGLADSFDGLGVRDDSERRLQAMRDSATGVFGVLAVVGWGLLMLTALTRLSAGEAVVALAAAATVARWAGVAHGAWCPPARRDGLGAAFSPSRAAVASASVVTAAIVLTICGPLAGLALLAGALLTAAGSAAFARRSFGGRTGDTLGATIAIGEAVACLTLTAAWGS